MEVKRQARRAALSSSPVLLLGETGTGKELLAHAIHAASARAAGPLVSVNIAAVPDTLLEAEFFGVAPGAYTGADRKGRDGKFKLADGGTLFLDEIGDMPLALQPKLLRALQEGEIEPLGSNKVCRFDARVIAATSRDLAALVREGKFREDLYYRLNVLPIRVPPLRERRADIPALVEVLVEDIALRNGTAPLELSAGRAGDAGGAALARQHPRTAQRAGAGRHAQRLAAHRGSRTSKQVLREAGIERIAARAGAARGGIGPGARATRCGRWPSRWRELERAGDPGRPGRHRRQQAGGGQVARTSPAPSSMSGSKLLSEIQASV